MKKQFLALLLVFAGFMSLKAATVSIIVVEAGLPPGTGNTPSASVWENGMMEVLFDAGHIVLNAPVLQITKTGDKLPYEAGKELNEAKIGGADFFVMVLLNYPQDNAEQPNEIVIRIFKVSTGELFHESSTAARPLNNTDEIFLYAKQNAEKLIPRLASKG